MEISEPEYFKLFFDAKKFTASFSGAANTEGPKLYVVVVEGTPIYVGVTKQKMRQRLYTGWNPRDKNGYHGYAWRHKHIEADLYVWRFGDGATSHDLETVEGEVVFMIRNAGQWPSGQTEIHFHPSREEHRELAARIVESICASGRDKQD